MTSREQLEGAFRRWINTHAISGEIPLFELGMDAWEGHSETLVLYESPASRLRSLLNLDSTARAGVKLLDDGEAADMVVGALRVRALLEARQFAPFDGPAAETDLARLLAALGRVLRGVTEALDDAESTAARVHQLRGSPYGESDPELTVLDSFRVELGSVSEAITPLLAEAVRHLSEAEYRIYPRLVSPGIGASFDGLTMLRNLCVISVSGSYPSMFHVRLFSPAEGPKVVLVGELADNKSKTMLSHPAKTITEIGETLADLLDGTEIWVSYLPQDYGRHRGQELPVELPNDSVGGNALRVLKEESEKFIFHRLEWAELEDLVDGPIKRWHSRDYRMPVVLADGASLVDRVHQRRVARRTANEPTRANVRCARWFCRRSWFESIGNLPEASCPVCGGRSLRIIGVFHHR
ncbi:hypothetical protein [Actinoplanes philippinensis]|uniref:hypothetical protein n=1 Tax=Actinoplanes philippinensis TaxID=35752 RepID=UPI0033FF9DD7